MQTARSHRRRHMPRVVDAAGEHLAGGRLVVAPGATGAVLQGARHPAVARGLHGIVHTTLLAHLRAAAWLGGRQRRGAGHRKRQPQTHADQQREDFEAASDGDACLWHGRKHYLHRIVKGPADSGTLSSKVRAKSSITLARPLGRDRSRADAHSVGISTTATASSVEYPAPSVPPQCRIIYNRPLVHRPARVWMWARSVQHALCKERCFPRAAL